MSNFRSCHYLCLVFTSTNKPLLSFLLAIKLLVKRRATALPDEKLAIILILQTVTAHSWSPGKGQHVLFWHKLVTSVKQTHSILVISKISAFVTTLLQQCQLWSKCFNQLLVDSIVGICLLLFFSLNSSLCFSAFCCYLTAAYVCF